MISFVCRGCRRTFPQSEKKPGTRCPRCARENERERQAKHPRDRSQAARKRRAEVIERFDSTCVAIVDGKRCDVTERLEVHHVDGDQTNDEFRNLVPLCPPHHRLFQYDPDAEFAVPRPARRLSPIGGAL